MNIETISKKKIGLKGKEENAVYRVSKKNGGKLTINDVKLLKQKFQQKANKEHDFYQLNCMKFMGGAGFKTATDENDLINYFENLVKDPDKFVEFDFVDFNVNFS
jgi:hypothetical protein